MDSSSRNKNFAFIDSHNVYLGVKSLGWEVDFKKLRIYLRDKYRVGRAYLFLGYIPQYKALYTSFEEAGYICIFKSVLVTRMGEVKGNCDAELVLQAMIDFDNYESAVVITGDGDFHCLIDYLYQKQKLDALIIPNKYRCSALLKLKKFKTSSRFMSDLQAKLQQDEKRKAP
jgi:uncharacterized LabA/DUF88 family protein